VTGALQLAPGDSGWRKFFLEGQLFVAAVYFVFCFAMSHDLKAIEAIRRQVGMVFQQFNLSPHLTVLENLTLDPEMIREVLDVMIELANQGITMICVTREMDFARSVADHAIFIDQGQIVEQNTPAEFFGNPKSDLTAEGEGPEPYAPFLLARDLTVAHRRFAIRDFGVPSAVLMRATLDAIYAAIGARETIYLHCWGGVGRTGTVVGCLLREQGYSAPEAFDLLERKWRAMEKRARHPHSPGTAGQIAFIEQWERAGRMRLRRRRNGRRRSSPARPIPPGLPERRCRFRGAGRRSSAPPGTAETRG